jgi:tRNA (guanine37-N1)-methyltransferase
VQIDIVTIFPEYFAPLGVSLIGKAAERGEITFAVHDLRRWTHDVHHTVDDAPFGGGPGMVMKPEPWGEALDAVVGQRAESVARQGAAGQLGETGTGGQAQPGAGGRVSSPLLVIPTPSGVPFTQQRAVAYSAEPWLIFACGRYEGIDGRVAEDARSRMRVDEVSIGDYVLAGAEPAVLVMTEAICRLLPGVLGNAESAADDSFGAGGGPMAGLVEGPSFTRPRLWRNLEVPPVLLSGDHRAIARWRRDEALRRTARNRPDLVRQLASTSPGETGVAGDTPRSPLNDHDLAVLSEAGFPVTGEDVAH